jgi:hypothetical protein
METTKTKKIGRPKMDAINKRACEKRIYYSPLELLQVEDLAKSAGFNLSVFMRKTILNPPIIARIKPKEMQQIRLYNNIRNSISTLKICCGNTNILIVYFSSHFQAGIT